MTAVPLLTVTDHFAISGRGIVLMPDFSVPDDWRDREDIVRIVGPSGDHREVEARLSWTHFVIADRSVPTDRRSRVVVVIPGATKEEVPIGSQVFASQELLHALRVATKTA